jgi:membrane protein DedA with SNARE-associated domain
VRTFIAFPAGVARMNMPKFVIYTFIGSFIWCGVLGYAGMKAGENWESLKVYFHQFHYVIIAAGVMFVIWYLRRHFKQE